VDVASQKDKGEKLTGAGSIEAKSYSSYKSTQYHSYILMGRVALPVIPA